MEPVGEFTPCFLRVVARFSAHADPNTLIRDSWKAVNRISSNVALCIVTELVPYRR
jgi:hypothetical protein